MITTTEQAAKALQAIDDAGKGYPRRGVHVGGGIHIDLDKSDPGKGGDGAGWSLHEHAVSVDTKTGTATYPATDAAVKAIDDAKKKPLASRTDTEKALAAATVAAEPKPADPKPATVPK